MFNFDLINDSMGQEFKAGVHIFHPVRWSDLRTVSQACTIVHDITC